MNTTKTFTLQQITRSARRMVAASLVFAFVLTFAIAAMPKKAEAAFPGANGRIVYSLYDAGEYSLRSVLPDGTDDQPLLDFGNDPIISPDGYTIALFDGLDIWLVDYDGSNPRKMTSLPAGQAAIDMAWSPDGSQLAFECITDLFAPTQDSDICLINSDGTGFQRLTGADSPTIQEKDPHWNPAGNEIVFTYDTTLSAEGGTSIQKINVGTGTLTTVAPFSGADVTQAQFSPDGTEVTYVQVISYTGGGGIQDSDIYTISASGGGVPNQETNTTDVDWDPAYSPDGTQIVFHRGGPTILLIQGNLAILTLSSGTVQTYAALGVVEEPEWGRRVVKEFDVECTNQAGQTCREFNPEVPDECLVPGLSPSTGAFGQSIVDSDGFGYDPTGNQTGTQTFQYVFSDPPTVDSITCNFTVTFVAGASTGDPAGGQLADTGTNAGVLSAAALLLVMGSVARVWWLRRSENTRFNVR